MKPLPTSDNALFIRTDFSDPGVWDETLVLVQEPSHPFIFNMELVDDPEFSDKKVAELLKAIPEDYPHGFIVVADDLTLSHRNHPVLVVDLVDKPGRSFRAIASQVAAVDNNLSSGNMGFGEFVGAVDEEGVFFGFPEL
jgi:hypothetical protein